MSGDLNVIFASEVSFPIKPIVIDVNDSILNAEKFLNEYELDYELSTETKLHED